MKKMVYATLCLSLAGCGGGGGSSNSSAPTPNSVASSASNSALSSSSSVISSVSSSAIIVASSSSSASSVAQSACEGSVGTERNFKYEWSLENKLITFTNNNTCDSLYVWATSTPLCDGCTNEIVNVYKKVSPQETITMEARIPKYLSWKPEVIYSLKNGETFSYHPIQAGSSVDHNFKLILLDYTDSYLSEIEEFKNIFSIDLNENIRGDCNNFNWVDRKNGSYKISPEIGRNTSYCFVGNIQGYTGSGDAKYLPAIYYFVTDKTKKM